MKIKNIKADHFREILNTLHLHDSHVDEDGITTVEIGGVGLILHDGDYIDAIGDTKQLQVLVQVAAAIASMRRNVRATT